MHKLQQTWAPALAGFAGIGLGTGLLRFAYTPIIPALIHAEWATVPQAAWLGSANFWGGLVGMIVTIPLSLRFTRFGILNTAIVAGILSLFASSWNGGFIWLASLRFIQGAMGAQIMALLPGAVMGVVSERRHRLVGGITIAGMGFALVPSLTIPWVSSYGPSGEWILCGFFGIICGSMTYPFIRQHLRGATPPNANTNIPSLPAPARRPYLLFLGAYAIAGVSLIPDALYLSDYLVRALGATPTVAASLFSWFAAGLGIGALTGGLIAHRFGTMISIAILTCVGAAGNLFIMLSPHPTIVSIASFFFALWAGGTVALASIRTTELVGISAHGRFWPIMCVAYATGMWLASTAFATLIERDVRYDTFFWAIEAFMAVFLILSMASYIRSRPVA